ncbi:MAG TPA: hypothetical protein VGI81_23100 [Tepidisphaeraceae bacterium]
MAKIENTFLDYRSAKREVGVPRDYILVRWPRWDEEDDSPKKVLVVAAVLLLTAIAVYFALVGFDSQVFRSWIAPPPPQPVPKSVTIKYEF